MAKRAVLVGINNYSQSNATLRGCINDITMMNTMLIRNFGFDATNIRMLVDAKATKPNVLEKLRWLVADAEPGDVLVFHYSGHGSLITLKDERGQIIDRQQPIICTYELNWSDPLTFREVGKVLVAPEGVNITSILDCCHSGHDFRELQNPGLTFASRQTVGETKPRFLAAPVDPSVTMPSAKAVVDPRKLSEDTDILLTGCAVAETSADAFINGSYRGAFTYSLYQALTAANYKIDYLNTLARTAQNLKKSGFQQNPQIEGAMKLARWPVFGNPTPVVKK